MRVTCYATIETTEDGVERDAAGLPCAFRIWRPGETRTHEGRLTRFTENSAALLLAEQANRGRPYSIDVDHLSLKDTAPPEARKAVGWHRLEVRAGELWAVDVQWTDVVADGLRKDPPEWRFFSPAYDLTKDTREVVSYLNTALTNNPATWHVTALAATDRNTGKDMNPDEMKAALAAIAAGEDPKMAARAKAALAAFEAEPEAEAAADEPAAPPADEAPAAASSEAPDESASQAATASLATKLDGALREIAALKAKGVADERKALLDSRPDVSTAVKSELASLPVDQVRRILAAIPKAGNPLAVEQIAATQGATAGSDTARETGVTARSSEAAALDMAMGITETERTCVNEGPVLKLGVLAPKKAGK